jgi:DNA-binding transcriptional regulator YiaG
MSNHPNRSRAGSAASNPKPDEVSALREKYGLSQTEAAERWMTTRNAVQKWEAPVGSENSRRVHPLMWWAMRKILEE